MRKLKVALLALALVGLTTSAASAASQAWFTLEGTVPAGVSATQGPGQTLIIEKPDVAGSITLTIGYNVTTDNGPMAGWHIDLFDGPGLSSGNPLWVGTGYGTNEGGVAPELLSNFGQTSIALAGSQGLVGTFELTITKPDAGSNPINIFGTFGSGSQGDAGGLWRGQVGANPNQTIGNAFYGFNSYTFYVGQNASLPVIQINNVPEPATLALLGLGVVALIRRRR